MENFEKCMLTVADLLKSMGFSKKNRTFWRQQEGNWMVVNIQSSDESNQSSVKFTINFGICSEIIRSFEGFDLKKKPAESDCQVRVRIGDLMIPHFDRWWIVDQHSNVSKLSEEVGNAIFEIGIPFLEAHISDMDLVNYWKESLNTDGLGATAFEGLTILMKTYGIPGLEEVGRRKIESVKGYPYEWAAKFHLKRLGIIL